MTGDAEHLVEWHLDVAVQVLSNGKGTISGSAVVLFTVLPSQTRRRRQNCRGKIFPRFQPGVFRKFASKPYAYRRTSLASESFDQTLERLQRR